MATTTPNFGWPVPTSTDLVKDGATAIEALGDSIDASLLDLKGGTTGQVLSKNSNTDMDFTWVTDAAGDITGVTAGTGISGGGTSGTVTVTNSMATAIDAKGDLVAGTAADTFARLGVGTDGQVLTADSAEATGLKWATAAGGGMTLLSTTTLSGGTTTISSISGSYKKLIAVINALSMSTDQTTVLMRFNSDSGNNYDSSSWDGSGNMVLDGYIYLMGNVDNATSVNGMEITIPDYANTNSYKYCYFIGSGIRGVDVPARYQSTGHWASTSAISSISFIANTGTIDAGTVYLYGVN